MLSETPDGLYCEAGGFHVDPWRPVGRAVVTHAPSVTDLDRDPLEVIETGDWVKVDGDRGIVEVTKKG